MKKKALCNADCCEFDLEICCRDCEKRTVCPEVCDGEEGKGYEADCNWRIDEK